MVERSYSPWVLERVAIGDLMRLRQGITTIGRHPNCTILITEPNPNSTDTKVYVSRKHAEINISEDNQTISITDLASSNGIYINGEEFRRQTITIKAGDRIGIGACVDDDFCRTGDYYVYILKNLPMRVIRRSTPAIGVVNSIEEEDKSPSTSPKPQEVVEEQMPMPLIQIGSVHSNENSTKLEEVAQHSCKEFSHRAEETAASTSKLKTAADESDQRRSPIEHPQKAEYKCLPLAVDAIKLEKVKSVSANIESIFGEADEIILGQMKDINPILYNGLNASGKPQVIVDTISISSDDEENLVDNKETVKNKSPQLFDDKDEAIASFVEQADKFDQVTSDDAKLPTEDVNNPLPDKEVESYDESEELIFSQKILNDMKEELPDIHDEPVNQPIWLDDDDEYGEGVDTKVSDWTDWTTKLFSQSLSQRNVSEIYELDDSNNDCRVIQDNAMSDNEEIEEANTISVELYSSSGNQDTTCVPSKITSSPDDSPLRKISKTRRISRLISSSSEEEAKPEMSTAANLRDGKELTLQKNIEQTNGSPSPKNRRMSQLISSSEDEAEPEISIANQRRKSEERKTEPDSLARPISKRRMSTVHSTSTDQINQTILTKESIFDKLKLGEKPKPSFKGPPLIIEAPQLPKNKGKLRGVSAVPPTTHTSVVSKIMQNLRSDRIEKELSRKWLEKPSISKRKKKDNTKAIREDRKERLKVLAEKEKNLKSSKRKAQTSDQESETRTATKRPKVKVTDVNRGAFLAKEAQNDVRNAFKIPKLGNKISSETSSIKNINKSVNMTPSIIASVATLAPPKEPQNALQVKLQQRRFSATNCDVIKHPTINTEQQNTIISQATTYKEKEQSRASRTTNKITFASMETNFQQSNCNLKKLELISIIRSNTDPERQLNRKKKGVRFKDNPTIHYIDAVAGATKTADKKESIPMSTFNYRRSDIRTKYPILDFTEKILTDILTWSTEFLVKKDADAVAAVNTIYPMTNQFGSFENYKSVIFPLMKLEFLSMLEREYKRSLSIPTFKVNLEYVGNNKDRFVLITKYNTKSQRQSVPSSDLVLLDFLNGKKSAFGYISSFRRGVSVCNTLVIEIDPMVCAKEFFNDIKEIKIRPVVDNIRVEFGAFNAIYQLEKTPLFSKILNPMELLKTKKPQRRRTVYKGFDELNPNQLDVFLGTYLQAIEESNSSISLIQGPPGTGKSRMITNLALQFLYGNEVRTLDKKVLICAQSNGAVDVIAQKLYYVQQIMSDHKKFRIIRFGMPDKINSNVAGITLQNLAERDQLTKLSMHGDQMQNNENLKNQMLQLEGQIAEYQNRNIKGTVEEDKLHEMQKQMQLMKNILNQKMSPEDEKRIYTWHLSNANIVCTTLSSCVKLSQYINYFDICIIDEATQCTEPWTLLPLKFGIMSLIMVGDTQQLPATVLSKKANELGLGTSLFTRIQHCLETRNVCGVVHSLKTQYRMHPEICKWPNFYFYKNELINDASTMKCVSQIAPFSILNLEYSQNDNCNDGQITNNLEAEFVANLVKALVTYFPNDCNSYGIITPYAHQRNKLELLIRSAGLNNNIMVNTIDSYQGIEKDVIIISNARTRGVGFLANYQRLNVALTRPKKCLILCGNFKNLEGVSSWRSLLKNARERKLFHVITAKKALDINKNVIDRIKLKC